MASEPEETVADALARRVQARERPADNRLVQALRELGAVDRAVYEAVARTPTATLDGPVRQLSGAANNSRLWLGIAAAVALAGGERGRRAALEGVVAIGVTSAAVNLGVKPIARRRRPDRAHPARFEDRHVPMPRSGSFPSGHSACWPPPSPTPGSTPRPLPGRRGDRLGHRGRHRRHGGRRGRPPRPRPGG